jgi:hypothetical protein
MAEKEMEVEGSANESDKVEKEPDDADDTKAEQEKLGIAEESREHPWLTKEQIKRLVADHYKQDPEYYDPEEED